MRDNVVSELLMINACSPGKLKRFLANMWKYIFGVPKVVEEKKKEKNPKAACDSLKKNQRAQRSTRRTDRGSFQRNGLLAGHGCSMIRIRV